METGEHIEQGLDDFRTDTSPVGAVEGDAAIETAFEEQDGTPQDSLLKGEILQDGILEEESSESGDTWRFLRDILETLVLSILLFMAINAVSARIRVDGSSMVPTLNNGQFVMVNRLAYKFGDPSHGDIVVFHYPRDPEQEFIKRIIGLPGDNVQINNGSVYVNGAEIEEPYIAAAPRSEGEWNVPEGEIFVLGDNRNNSQDSRSFGPVSMENVIGKALFIYWPPPDWGMVWNAEIAG